MKFIEIFLIIFLFNIFLFANEENFFTINNNGKIDMHGGKSEKLIDEKNSLSNKEIKNIGIVTPNPPKKPQILIKNDKKENKK